MPGLEYTPNYGNFNRRSQYESLFNRILGDNYNANAVKQGAQNTVGSNAAYLQKLLGPGGGQAVGRSNEQRQLLTGAKRNADSENYADLMNRINAARNLGTAYASSNLDWEKMHANNLLTNWDFELKKREIEDAKIEQTKQDAKDAVSSIAGIL